MLSSYELRQKYLTFFERRGHAVIPSASLVPENDPSSLFTTAGMQPLVPYLLGKDHPRGKRIVNVQKCVRTGDIDDVGDNRHLTFFEMLGNWSLGDYFKDEAITWSLEFLTSKEEGLGLDINRLYVTTFKGEGNIPRDEESIEVWKREFAKHGKHVEVSHDETISDTKRIIPLGVDDNFWIAGGTGPCGGDTEIFYDTQPEEGDFEGTFTQNVDSFRLIEIWNNVFMEFNKSEDGFYTPLEHKNVDTGMGLERTVAVLNGKSTVFDIDTFQIILSKLQTLGAYDPEENNKKSERVVADHIRSATFMIADGVIPSNSEQGYVLRRLLRRAVRHADKLDIPAGSLSRISQQCVIETYKDTYHELKMHEDAIMSEIKKEEERFRTTLEKGMKEFNKIGGDITGKQAFDLYQSFGFPIEVTRELATEKGLSVDEEGFKTLLKDHQDSSRKGSEQRFKGGLADTSEMSVKYHTATHLLNAALRSVLGEHISQRGSNITIERMRFDFSHGEKMSEEQKKEVETLVNSWIKQDLPVSQAVMNKDEVFARGAIGVFTDTYGDEVSVYSIGNENKTISMELCGGPHVDRTSKLGVFTIAKEEAVSQGVRRIKATLNHSS